MSTTEVKTVRRMYSTSYDVAITRFECIEEAIEALGKDEVLRLINYTFVLKQYNDADNKRAENE
jgi:hypothetical protein